MVDKTLHRNLGIEQHEYDLKGGEHKCTGRVVYPALLVVTAV